MSSGYKGVSEKHFIKIMKHDLLPKDMDFLLKKKGLPDHKIRQPKIHAFSSSIANDRPKNKHAVNQALHAAGLRLLSDVSLLEDYLVGISGAEILIGTDNASGGNDIP